jgi:hypothetical protein
MLIVRVSYTAFLDTITGIGGLLMLFLAQSFKGYVYGLVSKVPSPGHHQIVILFMAMAYTVGGFVGTFVAPSLLEYQPACLLEFSFGYQCPLLDSVPSRL